MRPGKLPTKMLADLLARLPMDDPRVIVGPRVGEDAAVIDFGDHLLVAKTDPVTFATDLIGWYTVNVNANDIATMGAEPKWFMATLLLPETADRSQIEAIFGQLADACRGLGVTAVGGHTEVTIGIDRPIMIGCMMGEVEKGKLLTSAGAGAGDAIILSSPIAIEGTALLAREAAGALRSTGLPEESIARARDLLFDPGISVVTAARAAIESGGVTALHDPTEGGLATGLLELALASEVGLEISRDDIPMLDLTRAVCAALELDPLGLIASGSLLIAAKHDRAADIVQTLRAQGKDAAIIGRTMPKQAGVMLVAGGRRLPLPQFDRDEIARYFGEHA
ncbi:MAG: AIR synthase family protein [Armatimonadota bacterium]